MILTRILHSIRKRGTNAPISLMLIFVLILIPTSALGEEKGIKVDYMNVSIWPEYDEPRILGIFQGRLANNISLPAKVKFLLPKDAEVNQACALTEAGEHQCQVYETAIEGDFKALTYKLPLPTFFVDFYYNPLSTSANKSFDYVFRAPYYLGKLEMDVQQPLKATDFKVSPPAMSEGSDEKGFKYARYTYDGVNPDQELRVSVSYTKTDPKPSIEKPPPGGAQQGQAALSSRGTGFAFSPLVILLSITVSILLALVGYIIVTARGGAMRPAYSQSGSIKSKKQTKYSGKNQAVSGPINPPKFCTNCGSNLKPGNKFCSNCGRKTKR